MACEGCKEENRGRALDMALASLPYQQRPLSTDEVIHMAFRYLNFLNGPDEVHES